MTPATLAPLVTISVVTYEGAHWIGACLRSILDQDHPSLELLVLDNGSQDDTVAIAKSVLGHTAWASVHELGTNLGFAGGHNRGLALAHGEMVCLLNQDAVLDPRFIERSVASLARRPEVGSIQGLILGLSPNGTKSDHIDTTGLTVGRDRRFRSRGQGQPSPSGAPPAGPVFGADGPAPVYRMSALREAGVTRMDGRTEILDEDFFLYHEDTDLAWRLRLLGWAAWFDPTAIAWHGRGLAGPSRLDIASLAKARRDHATTRDSLAWRNLRLMQVKNETGRLFRRDALHIARRELGSLVLLLTFGPDRRATIVSLLRSIPAARWKRRQIQARRKATAADLGRWFA